MVEYSEERQLEILNKSKKTSETIPAKLCDIVDFNSSTDKFNFEELWKTNKYIYFKDKSDKKTATLHCYAPDTPVVGLTNDGIKHCSELEKQISQKQQFETFLALYNKQIDLWQKQIDDSGKVSEQATATSQTANKVAQAAKSTADGASEVARGAKTTADEANEIARKMQIWTKWMAIATAISAIIALLALCVAIYEAVTKKNAQKAQNVEQIVATNASQNSNCPTDSRLHAPYRFSREGSHSSEFLFAILTPTT